MRKSIPESADTYCHISIFWVGTYDEEAGGLNEYSILVSHMVEKITQQDVIHRIHRGFPSPAQLGFSIDTKVNRILIRLIRRNESECVKV